MFLLALLVPAHLQIRSVEMALPQLDEIRQNLSPDEDAQAAYPLAIYCENTAKPLVLLRSSWVTVCTALK